MKKKIVFLCAICAAFLIGTIAQAAPLGDIGIESISETRSSTYYGSYGWDVEYDISFINQNLIIDVDVQLVTDLNAWSPAGSVGADSSSVQDTWKNAISNLWGNSFDIFDGTYLYDTIFNVDWVATAADADFVVSTLETGTSTGRSNMLNWFVDDGNPDLLAAHEFGHMIGLYDEYVDGAVETDSSGDPIIRNSLMGNYYVNSSRFEDMYDDYLGWLMDETGMSLRLLEDTGDHFYPDSGTEIPEPGTMLLFGIGLLTFARTSRKKYN